MRAVRLREYEKRPTVDEIEEPRITGPNDVIVKIGGAGLCRTDLHLVEGQWAEKTGTPLPFTLGHENAGWVHEVGAAVEHLSPGDTVILHPQATCGLCRACRAGDDMHCSNSFFPGLNTDGGMADYLRTGVRAVVKIDPKLQPADVAALADAGLTAYHAVRKTVPLLYPGTKAVLIGAGGLGHIGIQALRALTPAEIVVVDRSEGALALAKSIGAHHTVLANGGHVQQVLDLNDGVAMLRRAGSYFVIGYGGAINVPTIDIISTEINFVGNLVGTFNDLDELMTLAAQGQVKLHTQTYPLDAVNDAMDDLDAGRLRGRGILVP